MEVCFLIGKDGSILWQDGGELHALPDSRQRWDAIWVQRFELKEIAHSHPCGPLAFSREDRTTMRAIWAGLGRDVVFSVVTPNGMIRTSRNQRVRRITREAEWVRILRSASGLERNASRS